MHHRGKLIVAHGICTAVCQHIEIYVLRAETECVETCLLHRIETTLYGNEVKFLDYAHLVQLEWNITTLVKFYLTHDKFVYVLSVMSLSAVEIPLDKLEHILSVVSYVCSQGPVLVASQLLYDAVDHGRGEHVVFLEHRSLPFKAVCGCLAAVRKLCQKGKLVCILFLMNVHIHICPFRNLKCICHFKSVTACHCKSGDELVQVCRSVRRTHLYGLLLSGVIAAQCFKRVGYPAHVALCRPSERNAHQYGTVSVAPA